MHACSFHHLQSPAATTSTLSMRLYSCDQEQPSPVACQRADSVDDDESLDNNNNSNNKVDEAVPMLTMHDKSELGVRLTRGRENG